MGESGRAMVRLVMVLAIAVAVAMPVAILRLREMLVVLAMLVVLVSAASRRVAVRLTNRQHAICARIRFLAF